jgi:hypothetical protein
MIGKAKAGRPRHRRRRKPDLSGDQHGNGRTALAAETALRGYDRQRDTGRSFGSGEDPRERIGVEASAPTRSGPARDHPTGGFGRRLWRNRGKLKRSGSGRYAKADPNRESQPHLPDPSGTCGGRPERDRPGLRPRRNRRPGWRAALLQRSPKYSGEWGPAATPAPIVVPILPVPPPLLGHISRGAAEPPLDPQP